MSKSFNNVSRETKVALKKQFKAVRSERKTKSVRWIPFAN